MTGTPGQALHDSLRESAAVEFDLDIESFERWEYIRPSQRNRLEAAAAAAIAAAPQPAPGPDVCECGHYRAHHAFSDDVCAVADCPCTRPRPAPQPAPASASQVRRHAEQQRAPGDAAVVDITGEVLTAAIEGKRIMLQLGKTEQPAPELTPGELELSELTAFRHLAKPAPELAALRVRLGEAAALHLTAAAERDQLRERLGLLEDGIGNLAAGLKLSASASRPSKKSGIEDGCAAALLGLLDPR